MTAPALVFIFMTAWSTTSQPTCPMKFADKSTKRNPHSSGEADNVSAKTKAPRSPTRHCRIPSVCKVRLCAQAKKMADAP
eukprot:scaffold1999_cov153-Amphora_coffeaeformis.AAC.8